MSPIRLTLSLVLVFALGSLAIPAAADPVPAAAYQQLHWRMIGPFRGGRVNGVSGVPGQPNAFYFGSVGGGVWKTTNGTAASPRWIPLTDQAQVAYVHQQVNYVRSLAAL